LNTESLELRHLKTDLDDTM